MKNIVHNKKEVYDVYIGRPSKWGNPFSHKEANNVEMVGSRDESISKYQEWLFKQPELLRSVHELRGKVLGCWCAPKSCHGEVLRRLAHNMVIKEGDVTTARKGMVIHVCNDAGGWGAGVSGAIGKKWPQARQFYKSQTEYTLGKNLVVIVGDVIVVNMIAQRGYAKKDRPVALDYEALQTCLDDVVDIAHLLGVSLIHMPKIGAGLSGGDWGQIEEMLIQLETRALKVVYELNI